MELFFKPILWSIPLAAAGWAYYGMKKKAQGRVIDTDDASFPMQMDHSKDKLRYLSFDLATTL
jgi:hypothetical protein